MEEKQRKRAAAEELEEQQRKRTAAEKEASRQIPVATESLSSQPLDDDILNEVDLDVLHGEDESPPPVDLEEEKVSGSQSVSLTTQSDDQDMESATTEDQRMAGLLATSTSQEQPRPSAHSPMEEGELEDASFAQTVVSNSTDEVEELRSRQQRYARIRQSDPWMPPMRDIDYLKGRVVEDEPTPVFDMTSIQDDPELIAMNWGNEAWLHIAELMFQRRYYRASCKFAPPAPIAVARGWRDTVANIRRLGFRGWLAKHEDLIDKVLKYSVNAMKIKVHDLSRVSGLPCHVRTKYYCPRCLPGAESVSDSAIDSLSANPDPPYGVDPALVEYIDKLDCKMAEQTSPATEDFRVAGRAWPGPGQSVDDAVEALQAESRDAAVHTAAPNQEHLPTGRHAAPNYPPTAESRASAQGTSGPSTPAPRGGGADQQSSARHPPSRSAVPVAAGRQTHEQSHASRDSVERRERLALESRTNLAIGRVREDSHREVEGLREESDLLRQELRQLREEVGRIQAELTRLVTDHRGLLTELDRRDIVHRVRSRTGSTGGADQHRT
jgi:hypothetical protein